jgi:putative ABC transport system ATP-binding protein
MKPSRPPVIRLLGVALTYPGPPPVRALRYTDLKVDAGEHVAVIGPSGSGKSTLLNVLGLLDRPTAGRYELEGIDVAALPEGRRTALRGQRIGFVFQSFHLLPYRTALENVALGRLYTGTPRAERLVGAARTLARVGLAARTHALPTTMSGGERQRVAIAPAQAGSPSLLLCDEPTGNLDSGTATTILDLLDGLHAEGMTILVITHDPAVAARAARLVEMRDGELRDGAGRDGAGRDGAGRDGERREAAGRDGERREAAGRDGERREGVQAGGDC